MLLFFSLNHWWRLNNAKIYGFGKINFIEEFKGPIFLETVFAVEVTTKWTVALKNDNNQTKLSILSKDFDDQQILESDRPKGSPDHTQSRLVVFDATFPW